MYSLSQSLQRNCKQLSIQAVKAMMERSWFMTSYHTNRLEYLNFRLPEARDELSRCVHLRNTPPIFLATPILDADILSKKA